MTDEDARLLVAGRSSRIDGTGASTPTILARVGQTEDPELDGTTGFVNGKVITLDGSSRIVEALASEDGRFTAVGSVGDVYRSAGPRSRVVDLQGRTVVPGFVDGHAHMDREGLKFLYPSLGGVRSIDDVLDRVARQVRHKKPGDWIVMMPIGDYPEFSGGRHLLAEQRLPTRWDLDRVAPHNPVYIKGGWFYWNSESPIVSIANSCALALAGVNRDTLPPHVDLEIGKDVDGEPNGVFSEAGAIGTVEYSLMRVVPQFSHEDRVGALRESMRRYNAAGTTSVYEGHGVAPDVIAAYQELFRRGEMTVRSHLVVSPTWDAYSGVSLEQALAEIAEGAAALGNDDDMLRIVDIHIERGNSTQHDIRKSCSSNSGWAGYSVDSVLPLDRATLPELLRGAARVGLRVNAITHDAELLDKYLDAFEEVDRAIPIRERRWVLQHLSFVDDAQLRRLRRLGVHTTLVPGTTIWKHGLERTARLPPEAANSYVPLRSFIERAVPFGLSTDNVPIEPMKSIWSAVTREDAATGKVIGPHQALSREQALRAFTLGGARLSFDEDTKGSIEVGKLADFVVLDADVMTVPPDKIRDIEVLMTVVGGETVHERM